MPAEVKESIPVAGSTEQTDVVVGAANVSVPLLVLLLTVGVSVTPGVKIRTLLLGYVRVSVGEIWEIVRLAETKVIAYFGLLAEVNVPAVIAY